MRCTTRLSKTNASTTVPRRRHAGFLGRSSSRLLRFQLRRGMTSLQALVHYNVAKRHRRYAGVSGDQQRVPGNDGRRCRKWFPKGTETKQAPSMCGESIENAGRISDVHDAVVDDAAHLDRRGGSKGPFCSAVSRIESDELVGCWKRLIVRPVSIGPRDRAFVRSNLRKRPASRGAVYPSRLTVTGIDGRNKSSAVGWRRSSGVEPAEKDRTTSQCWRRIGIAKRYRPHYGSRARLYRVCCAAVRCIRTERDKGAVRRHGRGRHGAHPLNALLPAQRSRMRVDRIRVHVAVGKDQRFVDIPSTRHVFADSLKVPGPTTAYCIECGNFVALWTPPQTAGMFATIVSVR